MDEGKPFPIRAVIPGKPAALDNAGVWHISILMRFSSDSPASRRARRSAFTLLEILVVLAIMGLLVGLAVTKVGGIFGGKQEDVARIFVQSSLKTPLTAYRLDLGDYPTTSEGIAALLSAPANRADRWRGPYIEAPGGRVPTDPWGEPYVYRYPGVKNKSSYDVFSKGPDRREDTADDIGNW
ncbi:type II secretion system major pseudopilin GspG [Opitutaceae bacterium]